MSAKLNCKDVGETFVKCLFDKSEAHTEYVLAKGFGVTVGFHPGRLEENRTLIESWLGELPEQFHEKTGGGWSFLNACQDKDGNQWADGHREMNELYMLGLGIGKIRTLLGGMPLAGGMPYFAVLEHADPVEVTKHDKVTEEQAGPQEKAVPPFAEQQAEALSSLAATFLTEIGATTAAFNKKLNGLAKEGYSRDMLLLLKLLFGPIASGYVVSADIVDAVVTQAEMTTEYFESGDGAEFIEYVRELNVLMLKYGFVTPPPPDFDPFTAEERFK